MDQNPLEIERTALASKVSSDTAFKSSGTRKMQLCTRNETGFLALPHGVHSLSSIEGLIDSPIAEPDTELCKPHSPLRNQILAALPEIEYERLHPHLTFVQLPLGLMLQDCPSRARFAYFPIAGIVTPVCMMQDGTAAALAITGNDGMIGTSLFMGKIATPDPALMQTAVLAYRLGANRLQHEFDRGGCFSKLLLQYTHSLIMQMAQTAVCNRYHTIEEQSCRWMLLMLDRLPSDQLSLTHESLSRILGVRREGVTAAAGKLQKAGVIRYRRRHITVLNSLELKKRACECYSLGNQDTQGRISAHRALACEDSLSEDPRQALRRLQNKSAKS